MENRNSNTRNLVLAAICAALITLFILFGSIRIPATDGYVHLGDSVVYLSAYLLPLPFALAASAVGAAIADLSVGAVMYIIPTAVIKALMTLVFALAIRTFKNHRILGYILGFFCGSVILTGGYFAYEWAAYGLAYAVSGVLWNTVQGIAGSLLTIPLIAAAKAIRKRW